MLATADSLNFFFAQQGYLPAESDADSAAQYMYYLFVNKFGQWYIQRIEALSATTTETKFAKGASGYAAAWVLRSSQTYAFPDTTFKDL